MSTHLASDASSSSGAVCNPKRGLPIDTPKNLVLYVLEGKGSEYKMFFGGVKKNKKGFVVKFPHLWADSTITFWVRKWESENYDRDPKLLSLAIVINPEPVAHVLVFGGENGHAGCSFLITIFAEMFFSQWIQLINDGRNYHELSMPWVNFWLVYQRNKRVCRSTGFLHGTKTSTF